MALVRHLGDVCVRTTHEGHSVVSIALQNLVLISEVVLIMHCHGSLGTEHVLSEVAHRVRTCMKGLASKRVSACPSG